VLSSAESRPQRAEDSSVLLGRALNVLKTRHYSPKQSSLIFIGFRDIFGSIPQCIRGFLGSRQSTHF
jgi:hypothetical protein